MATFNERLERVRTTGQLTTADLSIWFERPYSTVHAWLARGYEPWGAHADEATRLLKLLERAIARRKFPMPYQLSPLERREHVQQVRHALNGGLSQTRLAR